MIGKAKVNMRRIPTARDIYDGDKEKVAIMVRTDPARPNSSIKMLAYVDHGSV